MATKKKAAKPVCGRDKMRALLRQAKRDEEAPLRNLLKSIGLNGRRINTIMRAIRETESGAPRADVDAYAVQFLVSKGNTVADTAEFLGVSADTLERNFKHEIERGRSLMRGNLRALQFKHAETSYAMAIFLGKNLLGQRDVWTMDRFTDEEILARAREAGIAVGAVAPTAPSAEDPEEVGGSVN